MSGAVIATNKSLKVSQAVSASRTSTGTLYTCAANSYAIVNLSVTGGSAAAVNFEFSIDGKKLVSGRVDTAVVQFNGQYTAIVVGTGAAVMPGVFIGPGQALSVTISSGSTSVASVTGVEFINSP